MLLPFFRRTERRPGSEICNIAYARMQARVTRARAYVGNRVKQTFFFFFCFGKVNAYLNAISLRRQLLQNFKQLVNVAKLCDVSCLTLKFIKRDVLAVLRSASDY